MLPFCGYNMGDYWAHWLGLGQQSQHLPKIFHVNWFRRDESGRFIWPGYGENLRVLRWVIDRCKGDGQALSSPIGFLPTPDAIDTDGLGLAPDTMEALLSIDPAEWLEEMESIEEYFDRFGDRLPPLLRGEAKRVRSELENA